MDQLLSLSIRPIGSYLQGVFDNMEFVFHIMKVMRRTEANLPLRADGGSFEEYREPEVAKALHPSLWASIIGIAFFAAIAAWQLLTRADQRLQVGKPGGAATVANPPRTGGYS
jgi:hypothetical protein